MFTVVELPIIAVRKEPSETSEMTTQLLFGEQIEILETVEKWIFIKNCTDGYEGWISENTLNVDSFFDVKMDLTSHFPLTLTLLRCSKKSNKSPIVIPAGAFLPTIIDGQFKLLDEEYYNFETELESLDLSDWQSSISIYAHRFLNAPYLWGGKTVFGVDCSGFCQLIFSMVGISIPRDASEQVMIGDTVDFLSQSKLGDLAFFENDNGKIVHVGMLLSSQEIIHSSGFVKIDKIDAEGILSAISGKHTHRLRIVKRIVST